MDPISNVLQMLSQAPPVLKKAAKKPAPKKVPVSTKKAEIAKLAKQALVAGNPGLFMLNTDEGKAAIAGASRYGVPFEAVNRLVAAGRDIVGYGPDDTMGWDQKNFDRNLASIRKNQDAAISKSYTGAGAGIVGGLIGGGGLLTKGIQGAGNVLSRIPALEKAGKALIASQNLKKGETVKNIAKLAATGAPVAAAEEFVRGGRGLDVAKAAGVGVVAAPAAVGAMKLGGYLARPFVDLVRSKNYGQILRRITDATTEEMDAAYNAAKTARGGAEPTLFEILPKADRDKISNLVVRRDSPAIQEQAAKAIQQRAANVEGEMLNSVSQATAPRTAAIEQQFLNDLATSRGGASAAEDAAMAAQATRSSAGIAKMQTQQGDNIMDPVRSTPAYQTLEEILPRTPQLRADGSIAEELTEPSASLIRNAANSLRLTSDLTIGNVESIIRRLKDNKVADPDVVQAAVNDLEDLVARDFPDAAKAFDDLNAAYSAGYRTNEGFAEGLLSRLDEGRATKAGKDLNKFRNIYETPEGATGRALGQTKALRDSFSGTPQDAMRGVDDLANNTATQRAVAANLDATTAETLTTAAKSQEEGLRALAGARKATEGNVDEAGLETLGNALLVFNPASFPLTRMAALSRLMELTKLGEKKASYLVDTLFSQDPAKIRQGISMLDNAGRQGKRFLAQMTAGIVGASEAAQAWPQEADYDANDAMQAETAAEEVDYTQMSDEELLAAIGQQEEVDYSALSDEELLQQINQSEAPYGRQVIETVFPGAVVTDDIRDPNSSLGQKNPSSYHNRSDGAVDVRPIPGMTFEQFISTLQQEGYEIVEAIDEVNNPSGHATGPHWHVVFA
jgi:hypothetical protein